MELSINETKTVEAPVKEPEVTPRLPGVTPDTRRLNPDKLCPSQRRRIADI